MSRLKVLGGGGTERRCHRYRHGWKSANSRGRMLLARGQRRSIHLLDSLWGTRHRHDRSFLGFFQHANGVESVALNKASAMQNNSYLAAALATNPDVTDFLTP
jgi:hypothetical protein